MRSKGGSVIASGIIANENLFVLSALLTTISQLKSLAKYETSVLFHPISRRNHNFFLCRTGKLSVLSLYLNRYLRLTPLFAATVLLSMTLLRFLGSGPMWPILLQFFSGHCHKYWWSTLSYIGNYVNPDQLVRIVYYFIYIFVQQHQTVNRFTILFLVLSHIVASLCRYATIYRNTGHHLFHSSIQNENYYRIGWDSSGLRCIHGPFAFEI